ncbi:MAG: hypothetical protein EA401_03655 [Planctomycetota bacterium]|nr:MAG: hypothetical protein EA401_03655 [Planctomycetota bacterium]
MLARAEPGSLAGHVPDNLIYGPVMSRRFGRSLGVSFTPVDAVGCSWHCPYCQLGGGRSDRRPLSYPDPHALLASLQQKLHAVAAVIDVVTIAGSGEPLLHPQAIPLLEACGRMAHRYRVPLVLLTNGGGIEDNDVAQALAAVDRCYIKWDPGAPHGAWCAMGQEQAQNRRQALIDFPQLRIQSLLYHRAGSSGNAGVEARQRWLEYMQELQPVEIQLSTAARNAPDPRIAPVEADVLEEWVDMARQALPNCQVQFSA